MLSYLLAGDLNTSPQTLVALVAHPALPSGALATALMNPGLPLDAPIGAPQQLTAADTHRVLAHPRTTPARRPQILAALREPSRTAFLGRYADMTTAEIDTYVGDPFALTVDTALAAARNPHTSPELASYALRLLACAGTQEGTTLLVLAAQHGFNLDFMVTLTTLTAVDSPRRQVMEDYLQHSSVTHTPIEHTLMGSKITLRRTISESGNLDLMHQFVERNPGSMSDVVRAQCPRDSRGDALRGLLGESLRTQVSDQDAVAALTGPDAGSALTMLESPELTAASLRPIFEHTRATGDERHAVWALSKIAAHPACPPDVRTAALDLLRGSEKSKTPFYDEVCTEVICDQLDAGAPHPALGVPVTVIECMTPASPGGENVNQYHVRTAAAAHPAWPLAPDAASVMLSLEPTFEGTLGELFDTLAAVTT